jgi:hypothetical protein
VIFRASTLVQVRRLAIAYTPTYIGATPAIAATKSRSPQTVSAEAPTALENVVESATVDARR